MPYSLGCRASCDSSDLACRLVHFVLLIQYLTVWGAEPVVTHQTSWLDSTSVCPYWTHAGCPCLMLSQLHMLHEPASSLLLLLPVPFAGCTCHAADSNKLGKASILSIK